MAGLGCRSVVRHLPSIQESLGAILSTENSNVVIIIVTTLKVMLDCE